MADKYELLKIKSTIVVAGAFHPGIFTPDWFDHHKILSKETCDAAKIKFIDGSVVDIHFDRFRWYAEPQRIMVELLTDGFEKEMLDLLKSVLTMFPFTKITALGVNFDFQVNINSFDDWHKIGHEILPKEKWKSAFQKEELHYGMLKVELAIDSYYGEDTKLNIFVRSANKLDESKYKHKISFEFNNHILIKDENEWFERIDEKLGEYFSYKETNTVGYEKMINNCLEVMK